MNNTLERMIEFPFLSVVMLMLMSESAELFTTTSEVNLVFLSWVHI